MARDIMTWGRSAGGSPPQLLATVAVLVSLLAGCARSPHDSLVGLWLNVDKGNRAMQFKADGTVRMDLRPRSSDAPDTNNITWALLDGNKLKITINVLGRESAKRFGYQLNGADDLLLTDSDDGQVAHFKRISEQAFAQLQPQSARGWEYERKADKVRGTTDRYATAVSAEIEDGTTATLTVRDRAEDGLAIMFGAGDGQYVNCTMICELTLKSDGNPPVQFHFAPPDGLPSVVFAWKNERTKVLALIRQSSKLIVEIPIINNGPKQYEFAVSGLKWE